ncbi:MAG: nucleotidyltransferase substrate binding protein [Candidatus Marinimicrobia bacterium]|nr:nucleotidyltransferase substrate binding protein [Candidatus Neomarinimicrobiota bacterium]
MKLRNLPDCVIQAGGTGRSLPQYARSSLRGWRDRQYFEFCFELAWKSIKIFCEEQGLSDCNSPKKALKQAFALKWIGKEEIWLEMLSARNQMAHTYDSKDALQIYYRLSFFVPELSNLAKKLQQELTDGNNP